jgi:hypothetical protein
MSLIVPLSLEVHLASVASLALVIPIEEVEDLPNLKSGHNLNFRWV